MGRISFISLILCLCFIQNSNCKSKEERDLPDSILFNLNYPESNLDSLLLNWYHLHPYQDLNYNYSSGKDSINIDYPDSVYISRLKRIPSVVPLSYNKIVKNYIKVYTEKRRKEVENMLGLTEYYFPIFEEILEQYDLPLELKYLPIIESALNPNAVSPVRATGLWQFMLSTAKMYKLNINSLVDDRRDPVKSTHAAAKFIQDLYKMYNDWILVIAAYNCGPGNVNKAIRRTGNKRNYWEIYYYLPRETRGYVPAFIAATYVFNYYQRHNLYPVPISYTIPTDTLLIKDELHFGQVSEVLNIPLAELRAMNPQYRWDVIPKSSKGHILKISVDKMSDFIMFEDSIYSFKDSVYFNPELIKSKPNFYSKYSPVTPKGYKKLYYTVKSGDNIGYIAEWYKVRASDIRYWNNIRGNLIKVGQKLVIFKPNSSAHKYVNINSMSFAAKQKSIGIRVKTSNKKENEPSDYELVYYKVKRGDTIWGIARNYEGVSGDDILELNNIKDASKINAGQTLKIKKPVY